MDIAQYWIPAVAGLLSGAVGSLIAPWVHWGIESRRERQKARRELLAHARSVLANPPPNDEFRRSPLFFQLKPFLSPSAVRAVVGEFKNGQEVVHLIEGPHGGVNPYADLVLDDLAKKEQEWHLL